jgi:branched-chain amino acid transport system substrate-binding protein
MLMSTVRPRTLRAGRRLLAVLVAGGLVLAACGSSDDEEGSDTTEPTAGQQGSGEGNGEFQPISGVPGVTDDTIAFAALGTGAASDPLGGCNYECYVEGIEAYFAYRNSQGGLMGRDLELAKVVDDQLGENQVKSLEIIQAADTFGVFAMPTVASGFPALAEEGVPLYTVVQFAPEVAGQGSSYAIGGATCITCTSPFYAYAAQLAGASKVASIGYGVSPASKQCVKAQADSIEKHSADSGVEVAYTNDTLIFGLPNGIAPEVTAMGDAGVDLILTCLDQRAVRTLELELQKQQLTDVKVLLPRAVGDPTLLEGAGDLFEGDLAFVLNRPYEGPLSEHGAMPDFLEWIAKSDVDDLNLDTAIQGWVNADMAFQGILAAGPQFDRAKVVTATDGIEDYTADGLVVPTDFGRQHVPPTEDDRVTHGPDPQCMIFAEVVDGAWKVLGDAAKPWNCWDPREMGTFTEPTPTDFQ